MSDGFWFAHCYAIQISVEWEVHGKCCCWIWSFRRKMCALVISLTMGSVPTIYIMDDSQKFEGAPQTLRASYSCFPWQFLLSALHGYPWYLEVYHLFYSSLWLARKWQLSVWDESYLGSWKLLRSLSILALCPIFTTSPGLQWQFWVILSFLHCASIYSSSSSPLLKSDNNSRWNYLSRFRSEERVSSKY